MSGIAPHKAEIMIRRFLTKQLIILILPIFVVLLTALAMAYLSVSVGAQGLLAVPFSQEGEFRTVLVNVLFFVGLASLSVPFLYFALRKGWLSLLEKMFAIGAGFLTLSLSGLIGFHLYNIFPSLFAFFLAWLATFSTALSIALVLVDFFSEETRNLLFMMYSSVGGSLLGMSIPRLSMVHILLSLCIIDLVAYRAGLLKTIVSLSEGETVFFRMKYSERELIIGLGDLVYFSMLASYSLVNFGMVTAVSSSILVLMGFILTLFWSERNEAIPGLPLSVGLGLIPITLSLNPIYIFALAIPLVLNRILRIIEPKLATRKERFGRLLTQRGALNTPRYPNVRKILSVITIATIFVVSPVIGLLNYKVPYKDWFPFSLEILKLLFTDLLFSPLVYTGIICSIYLLGSRSVRRFFAILLLAAYLFVTTFVIPIQLFLIEFFKSLAFTLPLYISVTFLTIYSVAEPTKDLES